MDFSHLKGTFRPLHGINKGPLAAGGLVDVSEPLKALAVPVMRLHDCHWPNPDVVDIHVVFPNFQADPTRAENYDFALTDEYLAAVRATGAEIVYRLGESIEHTSTKRFVHPPQDPEKWAAIALGIIRHYNEGWANGFHYRIRYWEVWNEPENRPAMWSGTDKDYFRLYGVTARAIKTRYPELKVGGPAVGYSGSLEKNVFQPSDFVKGFLDFCRRENVPLDFFSWHCYTADRKEMPVRAQAIRRLLDTQGFAKTESHLNEWNYLPGGKWDPISRSASAIARQQFIEAMGGAEGATFIAAALLRLQEAPVDVCCLFHGETGAFGLFTEQGVPKKAYYAVQAVHEMSAVPKRVEIPEAEADPFVMSAGLAADNRSAAILIAGFTKTAEDLHLLMKNLPWKGRTHCEIRMLDEAHDLTRIRQDTEFNPQETLVLKLKSPCVLHIRLRPADPL